jgi:archaellum component FlaC
MAQFETIMLVALGFVVALLIGLVVVRGVWSYAVGLGKRRSERRAPSHIAELKADRDRLKAEFAMQGRRLQLRLDDLKTRMAEQMAEASRNRNRMELMAAELTRRDEEIARHKSEVEALQAQAGTFERELAQRTEMTQAARDELRNKEAEIAELRTRLHDAEARLFDHSLTSNAAVLGSGTGPSVAAIATGTGDTSNLNEVEQRLRKRIDELNTLTRQIDEQRRDLSFQHTELNSLRAQIEQSRQADGGDSSTATAGSRQDRDAAPSVSLIDIDVAGRQLEDQIIEAERETETLTEELAKLDRMWNESMSRFETGSPADAKAKPEGKSAAGKPSTASAGAGKARRKAAARSTAKSTGKGASARTTPESAEARPPRKPARSRKPAKPEDQVRLPSTESSTVTASGDPQDNVISLAQRIRSLQGDLGKK